LIGSRRRRQKAEGRRQEAEGRRGRRKERRLLEEKDMKVTEGYESHRKN
jgi:hypothetical protein